MYNMALFGSHSETGCQKEATEIKHQWIRNILILPNTSQNTDKSVR